jgi:hypothetical protein
MDRTDAIARERRLVGRAEHVWMAYRPTDGAWPAVDAMCGGIAELLPTEDHKHAVVLAPGSEPGIEVAPGLHWGFAHLGSDLAAGANLTPDGTVIEPARGHPFDGRTDSLLGLMLEKVPELFKRGEPFKLGGTDQVGDRVVLLRAVLLPLSDGSGSRWPGGCFGAANMRIQA